MLKKLLEVKEITGPITDNETWNNCPTCGYTWKDTIPTAGLIHRTKLCRRCEPNDSKKYRQISTFRSFALEQRRRTRRKV